MTIVAGVDGCKGGWLMVRRRNPFPNWAGGDPGWTDPDTDPAGGLNWEALIEAGISPADIIAMFERAGQEPPKDFTDWVANEEAKKHVPLWLHEMPSLRQAWIDAWIETGEASLAREAVREHEDYEQYFPGNLREDGTVHITEGEYHSLIEGYENVLVSVGLNPETFHALFANLVAGDVDIGEFTSRVEAVRVQVIDQGPAVQERMSTYYGIDYTPEAIFASFLDPTIGDDILNRRIAVSQVGAAAWEKGFDIGVSDVELILNQGFGVAQARDFYAQAEAMLPALQVLMARHDDPDDDFDLNAFTQAQILDDPVQRQKIRRALAQERSSFVSGAGGPIAISQTGRRIGLEER